MEGSVVTIVLLAALLHASWNALVKAGPDKYLTTVLVAAAPAWSRCRCCRSSPHRTPTAGRG
jgi:hypothetical protein